MRIRKILKWVLITVPLVLVGFILFVLGSSYIQHRNLVAEEIAAYPPPGAMVEVNENNDMLHVYSEGSGPATLVFLSGLGTSSPVYDFQVLYRLLAHEYRVTVVERAGYGWSDITDSPRDLDTVLDETRTALREAGEQPPYVLFPHSLAGLEAIHWARTFPDEVEAIIGLDPLVPDYYEQSDDSPSFSPVVSFLVNSGLVRHNEGVFEENFPAMRKGHLNDIDAEIARTLFFRRIQTKPMHGEIAALPENGRLLSAAAKPDVPFHVFISAHQENEEWRRILVSYAEATGGEHFVVDGGHYVHLYEPDRIARTSRELIEQALRMF